MGRGFRSKELMKFISCNRSTLIKGVQIILLTFVILPVILLQKRKKKQQQKIRRSSYLTIIPPFEVSRNFCHLAILLIFTCTRKSKINLAKQNPPYWPLSLGFLVIRSDAFQTELTWQVLRDI